MVENAIVAHGLAKNYERTQVVHGIDLDIRAGEVFALLGPNGAGKTTTVEILEGIRHRSAGEVRVLGEDPARNSAAWRARIGVVPQQSGIFDDLTTREVVAHFAAFYPDPLPVGHVLELVGLGQQQAKRAAALSGGQQRRLDVAIGIVGNPELIFLDEPTTGLDPEARRAAWDLVGYLSERGATTVLTTHYLDEAEQLADRVALLIAGRVVEMGRVAELRRRLDAPATVSFGCPESLRRHPLPVLPSGTRADLADDVWTLRTPAPTATAGVLAGWAHESGISELPDFRVHQPTLEDIYLDLVRTTERAES